MNVILSLGSINADFQMRVEDWPRGAGTVLTRDLLRASGGKAANVAVLARRLGAESRLLGCVGDDDLAELALAGPRAVGVDLALVERAPGPTGLSTILVSPGGEKMILLALNANDAWSEDGDRVTRHIAEAGRGSVLVADLEAPVAVVSAAVRAACERGVVVVLDPAPPTRVPDELFPFVDHITPDHREAQQLTGIDASSTGGAFRAAEALRERGVRSAYVKLASGGCAVAFGEGTTMVPAPPGVRVVDTTGAGDAFAGALAWALMAGCRPIDAAHVAVAASSCAVTKYGSQASYPTPAELEEMAHRVGRASRTDSEGLSHGQAW